LKWKGRRNDGGRLKGSLKSSGEATGGEPENRQISGI